MGGWEKDFTRLLRNVLTVVWITTQFAKTDRNRDRDREQQLANGNEAEPERDELPPEQWPEPEAEETMRGLPPPDQNTCMPTAVTAAAALDPVILATRI